MAFSNRSKFLEMCEGLLARVEPPLRSVLDQASKWGMWGCSECTQQPATVQAAFACWAQGFTTNNNSLLSSYKIKKLSHSS